MGITWFITNGLSSRDPLYTINYSRPGAHTLQVVGTTGALLLYLLGLAISTRAMPPLAPSIDWPASRSRRCDLELQGTLILRNWNAVTLDVIRNTIGWRKAFC